MWGTAIPSSWNAVEMPIRGENRSSAHSITTSGSSPSNATESSPASSSSISSALMPAPRRRQAAAWLPGRLRPASGSCNLLPDSLLRRLEPRQLAQLLVGLPARPGGERVAAAVVEPALDQPDGRVVEPLGRDAPEERPPDRRVRPEAAADEDVVRLPPGAVVVARRRALEAEVADPVLRAGVRAAVQVQTQRRRRLTEALLDHLEQPAQPRLRLRDREVAVRLARGGDRAPVQRVEVEREAELLEPRPRLVKPRLRDIGDDEVL